MKRVGVFLFLPGWDASPSQGYPRQKKMAGTHLYTWVERGTARVKCLAQEHNTMSLGRAQNRNARSRDERTNYEAIASLPFSPHADFAFMFTHPTPYIVSWRFKQIRISSMNEISLIPSVFQHTLHASLGPCKLK